MINKKYLKSVRNRNRNRNNNFIYDEISKRIIDSLDLVKINFYNILQLGVNENKVYEYLIKKTNKCSILQTDISKKRIYNNTDLNFLELDLDNWKLNKNKFDLIYSNLYIHLFNNIDLILKNIHDSLKKNGFIILAIPDKNNVYQLINSLMETDLELYKGVFRRINPTIDINKILLILKKLNFDIPTVNTDKILINYSDFKKLLDDNRSMNLSYCYSDKKSKFENKNFINKLEKNYKKNYYTDNCYNLELKINFICAWK